MKAPNKRSVILVVLTVVFLAAAGMVGNSVAYMTNSESIVNNVQIGTVPETTTEPEVLIFVIAYDANGGTDAPAGQTAAQGEALALSGQYPSHSEGYMFVGWAADSAAAEAQYQPGELYTAQTDVTLHAVWKQ